jgi:hypothetical protein
MLDEAGDIRLGKKFTAPRTTIEADAVAISRIRPQKAL